MRVTLTTRHCRIPPELRVRARTLLEHLGKSARRTHDGRVVFGVEHDVADVKPRLHRGRQRVHAVRADAADDRTALDGAAARLRRPVDKTAPRPRGIVR